MDNVIHLIFDRKNHSNNEIGKQIIKNATAKQLFEYAMKLGRCRYRIYHNGYLFIWFSFTKHNQFIQVQTSPTEKIKITAENVDSMGDDLLIKAFENLSK